MSCIACSAAIPVELPDGDRNAQKTTLPEADHRHYRPGAIATRFRENPKQKLVVRTTVSAEEFVERDWDDGGSLAASGEDRRRAPLLTAASALALVLAGLTFWRFATAEAPTPKGPSYSAPSPDLPAVDPQAVAENFLKAESLDERLLWIREPEKYARAVEAHFSSIDEGEAEVEFLRPLIESSISDRFVQMFHVRFSSGLDRALYIVEDKLSGRLLVDWESYARSGSASWGDILSGQSETAEVRVFVFPAMVHYFPFGESGDDPLAYFGLKMDSPDCNEPLYGYVRRGSRTAGAIAKVFRNAGAANGNWEAQRLTLMIQSMNGSYQEQKFLITRVVAPGWVKTGGADFEESVLLPEDGDKSEIDKFEADVMQKVRREQIRRSGGQNTIVTPK
ncbi:MAG: hypothetical protein R3F19_04225 [Verrucomicrobiales bacterium]